MAIVNMPGPKPPVQNSEPKKLNKVVKDDVVSRKKSGIVRLADVFLKDDIDTMKKEFVENVLIPGFMQWCWDMGTSALSMIFAGRSGRSNTTSGASPVSYQGYFKQNRTNTPVQQNAANGMQSYRADYATETLRTREDAENTLAEMRQAIAEQGYVTIAQFYNCIGKTTTWTNEYWGWRDLSEVEIRPVPDGWKIIFPRPINVRAQ